ncbi:MAG TPA: PAS domain S-box protein [Candidatus Bathyarchaeia archaeon]|jgi:PAS domain S-box-containing protein|nr:PAS domain S-box protein [Candidatus Bathyarchaeia archaeon]
MSTRRSSGSGAHAAKSAIKKPEEAIASLSPEILKGMPVGMILLHLENLKDPGTFKIVDINPAAATLTGAAIEDLRGKTLGDFPRLLQTQFPVSCLEALRAQEPRNLGEVTYGDERIREGIYTVQVFPLSHDFLGVVFENVTEQRRSERALRESEERFRLLVQGVQEYGIFQLDPSGNIVSWNAGAARLMGYRAEEIIGKHFSVFYPHEEVQKGKPEHNLAEASRSGHAEEEGWRIRKDGSRFWANVLLTALRDAQGNLRGYAKLTRDMTERREREEALTRAKELLELRVEQRAAVLTRVNDELRVEIAERRHAEEQFKETLGQLRALAARLQSVREEERASISREIHDELGQACTAIKMDLALIGRKITKRQAQLRAKIESSMQLVDDMIVTLRRIASDLRPRTLDDLGLASALEWQGQEFEKRTGIRCHLVLPHEPLDLDPEKSIAIFRIFQESLTNVARHSKATSVEARLEMEEDQIVFRVHDNGKGFDPEEAKAKRSLGLVGMQERALLLQGEVRIEGVPGSGTTMILRIPLSPSVQPRQGM